MPGSTTSPPPPPPSAAPSGWYDDPSGQAEQQRYWDGTSWTGHVNSASHPYQQPQQPQQQQFVRPPKNERAWYKRPWPLIGGGFLLLILISAVAGGGSQGKNSSGGSGGKSDAESAVGINQPITVKGTKYEVSSVRDTFSVGDSFTKVKADGVFVIVEIQLTNLKNDTRTITSNAIKLVTSDGKIYDTADDALFAVDDQILLEQVQPGLPKKGTLVYDIPLRSTTGAKLQVEDLFSNDHGFIDLGL
jgi:hypothetical protein